MQAHSRIYYLASCANEFRDRVDLIYHIRRSQLNGSKVEVGSDNYKPTETG
jgi:hypothetical protein